MSLTETKPKLYDARDSVKDGYAMGQLDVKALETNFEGWRTTRVPDLPVSDAFERYVVEAVFKDADFSDEEISSGLLGGGNDGGVDGAYFTINGRLMLDDTPIPERPINATLWLIQAKNEKSFGEACLIKFKSFIEDALDYDRAVNTFPVYSNQVKEFIASLRDKLGQAIGDLREVEVRFIYASKSDYNPSDGVRHRKFELENAVKRYLSAAKIDCAFWGARALLDAKRAQPERTYSLEVISHFPHDGSFVSIARLDKFAAFLTDDSGKMRQSFLEPNVRDYNGPGNPVSKEIRKTLEAGPSEEFWWLNNGITILAEDCNYAGGRLNIKTPEIVNGLQTSTEIYDYFNRYKMEDKRFILIRVILPPNDAVRRRIIKATNSQSPVTPLSLHANDDIRFDIEEVLRVRKLYYDRRKGEYRRKMMPVAQIVSMTDVAQSVIAIALRAPDDARARPRKRLDSETGYAEVFDISVNRNLFLNCILLDRIVKSYLSSRPDMPRDERTDIRFYMGTWLAAKLTEKAEPTKNEIAIIPASTISHVSHELLDACCNDIPERVNDFGTAGFGI